MYECERLTTHLNQIEDRGVSTVIGVTVLVGVVVLLAALVGGVVFGLANTNQETAFAGVTVSQTVDSTVEVRVDSMGEAEALLVETAGGRQVLTSPGIYKYDSFGKEVRIVGSDGETTQLLRTFKPDVDSTETADVLTVESDQTVQTADGNQTFDTLEAAKQAADTGDVIQFASGVHVQPGTVNETVTTPVTVVAEPNTVFSCDQTKVNLRLQNATMSQRSAFIQTNQCGLQPVSVPAPEGSGGRVDVLAGGTDTSTSNTQTRTRTQSGTDTTLFDTTASSNTLNSNSQPTATSDTSVTVRVSSTSNYDSLTVSTQAGSQTFTEPGVYDVETYGYNATVSGTTREGETVQLDTIVSEEQQSDVTSDTTRNGETVNKTEAQPVDTYLVEADGSNTVASSSSDSVKRVSTLSEADSQASKGNLIKLESGVHSDPETVTASLTTNATLAISPNVELSCEQTKIDLSLGKASLSEQSPFPDVFCDEYSGISEDSVTETLTGNSVSIPETVSFDESLTYDSGNYESIRDVTTDDAGNVYVTGYSDGGDGEYDYYTIKYNAQGNEEWSQRYDSDRGDIGFGVAVDSNGNVYVTGRSDGSDNEYDYYTIKYNSRGDEQWSKRYDGSGSDYGQGVAVDSAGNIYVTGRSGASDGQPDIYTIKYNSNGNKIWSKRYDTGNYDYGREVAVDSTGNIYVTGNVGGPSMYKYYTVKYSPEGNEIWSQTYDSGNYDYSNAVGVDNDGNVYVTGGADGNGKDDYYTIKYNSEGVKQWSQRHNNGRYDSAKGIAVDGNGNIYVTGYSEASDRHDDYYTIKYNTTGVKKWEKRYDSGGGDRAYGVSVTDQGTVYVGGTSQDNYHLRKYTGS